MRFDVRKFFFILSATAGIVILSGVVTAARGQPVPSAGPSAAELGTKLKPGDRLAVTTRDLARIRGRLIALQDDRLVLDTESGEQRVPLSALERVGRRRHGMIIGPIIGAGVGVAFAIPVAMLFNNEGADATSASAFLIGLGAGIGLLVDAAIDLPRTVYRRADRPRVTLAPRLSRDRGGVALQVTF